MESLRHWSLGMENERNSLLTTTSPLSYSKIESVADTLIGQLVSITADVTSLKHTVDLHTDDLQTISSNIAALKSVEDHYQKMLTNLKNHQG